MLVTEARDAVVTLPRVGDNGGAWLDMASHEREQRRGGCISENRHPAPAEAFRLLDLNRNTHQRFLSLRSATSEPRLLAADESLVYLHDTSEPVPVRAHQHRTQAVQHCPRSLVRTDFKAPLEAESRDPVLGGDEQPTGGKPAGSFQSGASCRLTWPN